MLAEFFARRSLKWTSKQEIITSLCCLASNCRAKLGFSKVLLRAIVFNKKTNCKTWLCECGRRAKRTDPKKNIMPDIVDGSIKEFVCKCGCRIYMQDCYLSEK